MSQMKWDEEQLALFEMQDQYWHSDVPSTPSTQPDDPGPTPTDGEQLEIDFEWAEKLKRKYGISHPISPDDLYEPEGDL